MNTVASVFTRRTRRLWCALAISLWLPALGSAGLLAQAPTATSRSRDLEAEMSALKAQVQRFELQAPGTPSRNPDVDAMLKALQARLDRLESPATAGDATTADRQIADLRRQLDEQQAALTRLERRNTGAGIAFALLCACVCALWAISSGRRSGYWFLGGLVFNVGALFVALYHAREDALIRQARALGSSEAGTGN